MQFTNHILTAIFPSAVHLFPAFFFRLPHFTALKYKPRPVIEEQDREKDPVRVQKVYVFSILAILQVLAVKQLNNQRTGSTQQAVSVAYMILTFMGFM